MLLAAGGTPAPLEALGCEPGDGGNATPEDISEIGSGARSGISAGIAPKAAQTASKKACVDG